MTLIILRVLARRLRLAGWLGLLAVTSCLWAATAQARDTVLVLGDSISAAFGMQLEQGWVSLLDARLQKEQPTYRVINASISGETSGGGLRRLPDLLSEHAPKVVIIELGGNDGLRGYPVKQLRDNLKQLIRLSEEAAARAAAWAAETASATPEAVTAGPAVGAGAFCAAPPPWVQASRRMETPLNTREPPPDS